MAVIVHTSDGKRYTVAEGSGHARSVSEDIKKGIRIPCETRDWVTQRTERFDTVFNPDNVVSVTES